MYAYIIATSAYLPGTPVDNDLLDQYLGAVLLAREPFPNGISLRLEWIEISSYAGSLGSCMYAGAVKRDDGRLRRPT